MITKYKIFENKIINNSIEKILSDIQDEFKFFDFKFSNRYNYYGLTYENFIFCYVQSDTKMTIFDIDNNKIIVDNIDLLKEYIIYCYITSKIVRYSISINRYFDYSLKTFKNLEELIISFINDKSLEFYKIYNTYLKDIKFFKKYEYLFQANNFDLL